MTTMTDDDLRLALDRIARSDDGHLLYRYFQQTLCGVVVGANDGALREDNGRRRFASELMGHMAKGIEESGGRNPDQQPIVFARRKPDDDTGHKHERPRDYFRRTAVPAVPAVATDD